jgi:RHS repeat-associated protein
VSWYGVSGQSIGPDDVEAIDQLFEFTGRQRDGTTGLQLHGARWYDPEIGRWLSEDPSGFDGGDANLYRYVGNSPTNFVDPTGLSLASPLDSLFGGTTFNPYAGPLANSCSPIITQPRPNLSPGLSLGTIGNVIGNSVYNAAASYVAPTSRTNKSPWHERGKVSSAACAAWSRTFGNNRGCVVKL